MNELGEITATPIAVNTDLVPAGVNFFGQVMAAIHCAIVACFNCLYVLSHDLCLCFRSHALGSVFEASGARGLTVALQPERKLQKGFIMVGLEVKGLAVI